MLVELRLLRTFEGAGGRQIVFVHLTFPLPLEGSFETLSKFIDRLLYFLLFFAKCPSMKRMVLGSCLPAFLLTAIATPKFASMTSFYLRRGESAHSPNSGLYVTLASV